MRTHPNPISGRDIMKNGMTVLWVIGKAILMSVAICAVLYGVAFAMDVELSAKYASYWCVLGIILSYTIAFSNVKKLLEQKDLSAQQLLERIGSLERQRDNDDAFISQHTRTHDTKMVHALPEDLFAQVLDRTAGQLHVPTHKTVSHYFSVFKADEEGVIAPVAFPQGSVAHLSVALHRKLFFATWHEKDRNQRWVRQLRFSADNLGLTPSLETLVNGAVYEVGEYIIVVARHVHDAHEQLVRVKIQGPDYLEALRQTARESGCSTHTMPN